MKKRLLTLLTLIAIVLCSLLPATVSAIDYILEDGKTEISLSKQAVDVTATLPTETDSLGNLYQYFDITLSVSGSSSQTSPKGGGDILFVIDKSGSMESNKVDGRSLAEELEQQLNGSGSTEGLIEHLVDLNCNIGIVSFGSQSSGYNFYNNSWTEYDSGEEALFYERYFTKDVDELEETVSDALDIKSNGTNTEGGFLMAQTIANGWEASNNNNKNEKLIVVMITDGIPTYRYESQNTTNDDSGSNCSKLEFNQAVEAGQELSNISEDIEIFTFGMLSAYDKNSDNYLLAERLLGETAYKSNRVLNEEDISKYADLNNRWNETESYSSKYIPLDSSSTASDYKKAFKQLSEIIEQTIEIKVDISDIVPAEFQLIEDSLLVENSNSFDLPIVNNNQISINNLAVSSDRLNPTTITYRIRHTEKNFGNAFSNDSATATVKTVSEEAFDFPKPVVALSPKTTDDAVSCGVGEEIVIDVVDNDFLSDVYKIKASGYTVDEDYSISLFNLDGTPIDPIDFSVSVEGGKLKFSSTTGTTKEFLYQINLNAQSHQTGEGDTVRDVSLFSRLTKVSVAMTTSHTVLKEWEDLSKDNDSTPPNIEVVLQRSVDGETFEDVDGKSAVLTPVGASGSWTASFKFDALEAGNKTEVYTYRVIEKNPSKAYELTPTYYSNKTELLNTRKLVEDDGDVTITKVWNDNNNEFNNRPETLVISLDGTANNKSIVSQNKTLLVSDSLESQQVLFEKMPTFSVDDVEILYSAGEQSVPKGYAKTVEGLTITNSTVMTKLTVKKIFDGGQQEIAKIKSIKADILSSVSNEVLNSVEIVLPNFETETELLPTHINGEKAIYRADETEIVLLSQDDPILGEFTQSSSVSTNGVITITNRYNSNTRDFTVTKNWNVYSYQQYKRDVEITIVPTVEDETVDIGEIETTAILTAQNNYSHTFSALPITDIDGNEIVYKVVEQTNKDIFDTSISYTENGANITNTLKVNDIILTKVWVNFDDENRMQTDVCLLLQVKNQEDFDTVLELDFSTADFSGSKKISKIVENIPVYDVQGNLITYNMEEQTVPLGYEVSYAVKSDNKPPEPYTDGFNILDDNTEAIATNEYSDQTVTVVFEKVWDDDGDRDGVRPELTTVESDPLGIKLVGGKFVEGVSPSSIVEEGNSWFYTFENIPVFYDLALASYRVFETIPEEYTSQGQSAGNRIATEAKTVDPEQETLSFSLTNSHTPLQIDVVLLKNWEDDQDLFANRPDEVLVQLESPTEGAVIPEPTIVKQGDLWEYRWAGIFAFHGGEPTEFNMPTVGELPNFYNKGDVAQTDERGLLYDVTHTYSVETINHTVTKNWAGDLAATSLTRPSWISVHLEQSIVGENDFSDTYYIYPNDVILSGSGNSWSYLFQNLPAFIDGNPMEYRVREVQNLPSGYSASYSYQDFSTVITNTYTNPPESTGVTTVPQTDDRFPLNSMVILSAVSIVVLAVALVLRFKVFAKTKKPDHQGETYGGMDDN